MIRYFLMLCTPGRKNDTPPPSPGGHFLVMVVRVDRIDSSILMNI